jgi:hypothetical protein
MPPTRHEHNKSTERNRAITAYKKRKAVRKTRENANVRDVRHDFGEKEEKEATPNSSDVNDEDSEVESDLFIEYDTSDMDDNENDESGDSDSDYSDVEEHRTPPIDVDPFFVGDGDREGYVLENDTRTLCSRDSTPFSSVYKNQGEGTLFHVGKVEGQALLEEENIKYDSDKENKDSWFKDFVDDSSVLEEHAFSNPDNVYDGLGITSTDCETCGSERTPDKGLVELDELELEKDVKSKETIHYNQHRSDLCDIEEYGKNKEQKVSSPKILKVNEPPVKALKLRKRSKKKVPKKPIASPPMKFAIVFCKYDVKSDKVITVDNPNSMPSKKRTRNSREKDDDIENLDRVPAIKRKRTTQKDKEITFEPITSKIIQDWKWKINNQKS